jgi:hypothetical protein
VRGRTAKRTSENGAISSGVRPVAISSAICSPPAGIALKPHVPQPVGDQEAGHAGLAQDRAPVGRDVADPGPRPEDAHRAEERQQRGDLVGVAPERVERRQARERGLAVELGADQHLAALRLADIAGELGRGDDLVEALLEVVRDEGVERVVRIGRRTPAIAAAGSTDRRSPRRRRPPDRTVGGLDADDSARRRGAAQSRGDAGSHGPRGQSRPRRTPRRPGRGAPSPPARGATPRGPRSGPPPVRSIWGIRALTPAWSRARCRRRSAWFIRTRARSVRIPISVWAIQTWPLTRWKIAAPVSSSRPA